MTKKLLSAALAATLVLAACGDDDDDDNGGNGAPELATAAEINAYLNGKTLLMEGADIPSHPNGFDENTNFGAATQCYVSTEIAVTTNWTVTSQLGTLTGAPTVGSTGDCDRDTPFGNPLTFTSTNVLVENVEGNGECFDVTVTYTGFTQEGRAAFNDDATELRMELFFGGQASGHRCADGAVGSGGVTLNGSAFTGDAVQVYQIQ